MKAYRVTDGCEELYLTAESRAKATGVFIRHFRSHIDWKALRATRAYRRWTAMRRFCTTPANLRPQRIGACRCGCREGE
jgi:hypothetical protein